MKKKHIRFVLLLIFSIFILTGCSNNTNKTNIEDLKEKVIGELYFLETQLIEIANSLNNISLPNYIVTTSEANIPENTNQQAETGSAEDGQNGETTTSGDKEITVLEMTVNNILNHDEDDLDWEDIKKNIEDLYNSWNTIILDLNELNVSSETLLSFTNTLNLVTQNAKNENKTNTLITLSQLYSHIPIYLEYASTDAIKTNLTYSKSLVINSYAYITSEDWDRANAQLDLAIAKFTLVRNNNELDENRIHSVDKIYIILNDMKSSIELKDRDIYFINYRNLILEYNALE